MKWTPFNVRTTSTVPITRGKMASTAVTHPAQLKQNSPVARAERQIGSAHRKLIKKEEEAKWQEGKRKRM